MTLPDPRRGAVNIASSMNDDAHCPAKASQAMTALRIVRGLDSRAWRGTRGAPFQFVRWFAALATVVFNWVHLGTVQNTAAYVPVLAVVALLLLPDAQSIGIVGLRFNRLTNEMARQRRDVDRLLAEVSLINNSLIAGSQVNIALGATAIDAALAATTAHNADSSRQPSVLIVPGLVVEGVPPDHEPGIS